MNDVKIIQPVYLDFIKGKVGIQKIVELYEKIALKNLRHYLSTQYPKYSSQIMNLQYEGVSVNWGDLFHDNNTLSIISKDDILLERYLNYKQKKVLKNAIKQIENIVHDKIYLQLEIFYVKIKLSVSDKIYNVNPEEVEDIVLHENMILSFQPEDEYAEKRLNVTGYVVADTEEIDIVNNIELDVLLSEYMAKMNLSTKDAISYILDKYHLDFYQTVYKTNNYYSFNVLTVIDILNTELNNNK